jgi:hypothetical protein
MTYPKTWSECDECDDRMATTNKATAAVDIEPRTLVGVDAHGRAWPVPQVPHLLGDRAMTRRPAPKHAAAAVREYALQYPGRTEAVIAAELGMRPSVVARVLARKHATRGRPRKHAVCEHCQGTGRAET